MSDEQINTSEQIPEHQPQDSKEILKDPELLLQSARRDALLIAGSGLATLDTEEANNPSLLPIVNGLPDEIRHKKYYANTVHRRASQLYSAYSSMAVLRGDQPAPVEVYLPVLGKGLLGEYQSLRSSLNEAHQKGMPESTANVVVRSAPLQYAPVEVILSTLEQTEALLNERHSLSMYGSRGGGKDDIGNTVRQTISKALREIFAKQLEQERSSSREFSQTFDDLRRLVAQNKEEALRQRAEAAQVTRQSRTQDRLAEIATKKAQALVELEPHVSSDVREQLIELAASEGIEVPSIDALAPVLTILSDSLNAGRPNDDKYLPLSSVNSLALWRDAFKKPKHVYGARPGRVFVRTILDDENIRRSTGLSPNTPAVALEISIDGIQFPDKVTFGSTLTGVIKPNSSQKKRLEFRPVSASVEGNLELFTADHNRAVMVAHLLEAAGLGRVLQGGRAEHLSQE